MLIDLNHQSGFVYGRPTGPAGRDVTAWINAHVDGVLVDRNRQQRPRDYLGGSRVGEDCARKLVYEVTHTPKDPGGDFDAGILRIFEAGHQFEAMTIGWLRSAGFDRGDRAYQLTRANAEVTTSLTCEIRASIAAPLVNLALVVRNWGAGGATLELDGHPVPRGKEFRYGYRHELDGSTLLVWIQREATRPLTIRLTPAQP